MSRWRTKDLIRSQFSVNRVALEADELNNTEQGKANASAMVIAQLTQAEDESP